MTAPVALASRSRAIGVASTPVGAPTRPVVFAAQSRCPPASATPRHGADRVNAMMLVSETELAEAKKASMSREEAGTLGGSSSDAAVAAEALQDAEASLHDVEQALGNYDDFLDYLTARGEGPNTRDVGVGCRAAAVVERVTAALRGTWGCHRARVDEAERSEKR